MKRDGTLRRLLPPLLLCGLVLLLRGAAADAPRTLARCLPGAAPVVLEAEDLGDLLRRWQASPLRRELLKSAAQREFARGRVALRLLERLELIEASLGGPLTLDRLTGLAPRRAALGLYDIGETAFVLVVEAPERALTELAGAPGALQRREHRGLPYLAVPDGPAAAASGRRAPLRLAQLKGRLLVGNDPARFQEALLLTAADLGLPIAPGAAPPAPADRDPLRAALLPMDAELPGPAALRIYLGRGALQGSRHFRRFWLFGPESAAGLDGALLTFSLAPLGETHGLLYRAGAAPPIAAAAREADAARLVESLPRQPYAQVQPVDAAAAAARLRELLPIPRAAAEEDEDAGPGDASVGGAGAAPGSSGTTGAAGSSAGDLVAALAPAGPHRALEVADVAPGTGSLVGRARLGVVLGLRAAPALPAPAFEAALLSALGPLGAPEPSFSDEAGARVLRLPLLSGWTLCWARKGDRLAVATDPELLAELLRAPAELLRDGAPLARRIDLSRAAAPYQRTLKLLAQRDNWRDAGHGTLYAGAVGGLFDLARPGPRLRAITTGTYRRADLVIEQVRYVE